MDNYLYFDYIPNELLSEVLIYLDIDEIKSLAKVETLRFRINSILKQKIFWILKLKNEGLGDYIPFLGNTNSFLNDYKKFIDSVEEVYIFNEAMRSYKPRLSFNVYKDTNIKELINDTNLNEFKDIIEQPDSDSVISVDYDRGKYKAFISSPDNIYGKEIELSYDEFKLLLIKLTLIGKDLISLSNLEDLMGDSFY